MEAKDEEGKAWTIMAGLPLAGGGNASSSSSEGRLSGSVSTGLCVCGKVHLDSPVSLL